MSTSMAGPERYDWIVIGSGFGGSVSALRLVEKGYRVLVLEKGRRFAKEEFPKTNWDVKRWLWLPALGLRGLFQMTFLKHATILHGVGYGGGSLVYANTLPRPKPEFFRAPSWGALASWERELAPHYDTAERMLGVAENPRWTRGDEVLHDIARDIGREEHHERTRVGVFFGEPDVTVPDPYFDGEGPERTGCTFCGACMTGCRVGSKNTLDHNYLHLAERRGLDVLTETEVRAVRPIEGGYRVETRGSFDHKHARRLEADNVVFAGGVLGTVPLLLKLREDADGLPELSPRVGDYVRTNSEAIFGTLTPNDAGEDFTDGVAITSILHTDDHSHVEPVRYGPGSGFFRMLSVPHSPGANALVRVARAGWGFFKRPVQWTKAFLVKDFARQSQILLYMRTIEGTLSLRLGRGLRTGLSRRIVSRPGEGAQPEAFMLEATELLDRFSEKVGGVSMSILTETVLGVPTTAHLLGGACMGANAEEGVVDARHRVHGYDGLYVVDGAAMSANPGVNPSLTITAMAERAMSFVPPKA
jgi:cholesterol oxidase